MCFPCETLAVFCRLKTLTRLSIEVGQIMTELPVFGWTIPLSLVSLCKPRQFLCLLEALAVKDSTQCKRWGVECFPSSWRQSEGRGGPVARTAQLYSNKHKSVKIWQPPIRKLRQPASAGPRSSAPTQPLSCQINSREAESQRFEGPQWLKDNKHELC